MNESLVKLFHLQSVDKEIMEKEKMIGEIPGKIRELEGKINERKETLAEIEQRLTENHNKEMAADKKLQETKMVIGRHKQQLLVVKTNKEYAALMKEISTEEENIGHLEEEMIALLDEAEGIEEEKEEEEKIIARTEEYSEKNKKALQERKDKFEQDIKEKKLEREKDTAALDSQLLKRYDRIRKSRDGIAVVRIQGENCGGCFSLIPPQIINEVKRGDKILTCESCGRMLIYLDEGENN